MGASQALKLIITDCKSKSPITERKRKRKETHRYGKEQINLKSASQAIRDHSWRTVRNGVSETWVLSNLNHGL